MANTSATTTRFSARAIFLGFGVAISIWGAEVALAQPVGYSIHTDQLHRLELGGGPYTSLGSVGGFSFSGASFGADGFLYAISHLTDELWRIDVTRVAGVAVGPIGVDVQADGGLAFDACGTLWMVSDQQLYTVDPGTAAATHIASLGREVYALAWDGQRLLGLVDAGATSQLASLDTETGAVSPFGATVFLPTEQRGLDFDPDGRLWGTYWKDSPLPEPWESSIVEYDPNTGAILTVEEVLAVPSVLGGNFAAAPPRGTCLSAIDVPVGTGPAPLLLSLALGLSAFFLLQRFR